MLESVNIEGFRGIKECEEAIDLTEFTVLLGRNNAGKSSVLEALYLLFGGYDPISSNWRSEEIKRIHESSNLAYRHSGEANIEFVYNDIEGITEISNSVDSIDIAGHVTDKILPDRHLDDIGADISKTENMSILFPSDFRTVQESLKNLQNMRAEIEKQDAHVKVAELLNKCIGDEYTEIYLETLEARKKPPDRSPFYVDINDLGTGVIRVIPVFMAVETIDPEILLWDDMETSLHPTLMREVLEWLAERDTQVIASTHSIDVLSGLLEVKPKNASVVQLAKSGDDVVRHETLDLTELEQIMDNAGLDPRFLSDGFEL